MKISDIAFVHYPVTDKKRSRDFYEGALGLSSDGGTDSSDGFWIEYGIGSGTLALSSFWSPSAEPQGPCAAFEVENFDEAVAQLKSAGAPFTMEPYNGPVCSQAIVLDPDGNSIFIHKRKPGRG